MPAGVLSFPIGLGRLEVSWVSSTDYHLSLLITRPPTVHLSLKRTAFIWKVFLPADRFMSLEFRSAGVAARRSRSCAQTPSVESGFANLLIAGAPWPQPRIRGYPQTAALERDFQATFFVGKRRAKNRSKACCRTETAFACWATPRKCQIYWVRLRCS
jgi:hypothetical protein